MFNAAEYYYDFIEINKKQFAVSPTIYSELNRPIVYWSPDNKESKIIDQVYFTTASTSCIYSILSNNL